MNILQSYPIKCPMAYLEGQSKIIADVMYDFNLLKDKTTDIYITGIYYVSHLHFSLI